MNRYYLFITFLSVECIHSAMSLSDDENGIVIQAFLKKT